MPLAYCRHIGNANKETKMTEAHYTNGTKTRSATLTFAVTRHGFRIWETSQDVTGKAQARRLAKAANAEPWNF